MFHCDGDKWVTGGANRVNCAVEAELKEGHILRNKHTVNAFCQRSVYLFLLVLNKLSTW